MNDIKKRLDRIFKKYPDYTVFSYTMHSDSKTSWNFYTSIMGHNNFTDREKFVQFLDLLINTSPEEYKKAELERWCERRVSCQEKLEDIDNHIVGLKKTREEAQDESRNA